ncbi:G-type lectin S-receptor-like serine/threonine-protein kinase B120 isoform X5 [Populus trichocarpa]|uniref:G-type lectin S-receptor-like serine/threonine-protein kinase B120 isoform X3 n=1 Tax=Populus trichocarpa TaxID=3694 RepID=UPI002277FD9C|nr:G-type lectin S-receptor-like serine/threonine-protein kinase B120 isoform X3 [Populus trichocarpa]XP_052301202.1 G-type lectin S-receptor-like serine/threonine-protein kinase B120 isoform X5 [Populus trichocarpa]
MITMSRSPVIVFFFSLLFLAPSCHAATNTLTKGQSIKDGETLISVDENFELGFFSPGNSTSRYVGVRYSKIQDQAVIWVANRDKPISGTDGVLRIGEDGNLMVVDGNGSSVWSSNASFVSSNTTLMLDTTGNLILSSNDSIGDTDKAYWQSFNNPTDTYLPHMKVLIGSAEIHAFTSWKSTSDPSPGNFTMGVDPRGAPQIVVWEQSRRRWRSGHWNAQIFSGVPSMAASTTYRYGFKVTPGNDGKFYLTYNPSDPSELMKFQITWNGFEEQKRWNESTKAWQVMQSQPSEECEKYNHCGNFGVCTPSGSPNCRCLEGFQPRHPDQWRLGNWSGGCERRSPLQCQRNASNGGEDGFKAVRCTKLPDFADVYQLSSDDCKKWCQNNCSCKAYAHVTGIQCMIWNGDLTDVQNHMQSGNTLYMRLAYSELDHSRMSTYVIVLIVSAGLAFLAICIWLLWMLKKKLKATSASMSTNHELQVYDLSRSKEYTTDLSGPGDLVLEGSQVNGPDLPMFNFNFVAAATNNFSEENKLGQGGFGHVYKGKLPGGEEIAVKRLSKISGQGLQEFKNEIILIAKLQHRNLVRLLGCSIQGDEKMLIYEYMPNKSLDYFLFDPEKQGLLEWNKRFEIIEGIARGLLYLHRDSRLRIIHRDLKASNILLDEGMNPKISDFGMARIFGANQNEINTNRVVGTYGYMAPEYAMEGLFSVKSDVYSFGVLLLEIVSGRRNTSFRMTDHVILIAYAWDLWSEGKAMEMVDPSIRDSCNENEVLRCIQLGMLCVQDSALHRPNMASVVLMLESSTTSIPLPREPTFTSVRASIDTETFMEAQEITSSNDLTVSMGEISTISNEVVD